MAELRATCGAGTGCGGCLPSLRRLLRECLGTDVSCTAATVLEGSSRTVFEPSCSGNCAEIPEPGAPVQCVAGLADCTTSPYDEPSALTTRHA